MFEKKKDKLSQDAIVIVQELGRMLQGVSQQLEVLIRLECGAMNKHKLRDQIVAAEKKQQEQAKQIQEAMAELEEDEEAEAGESDELDPAEG